MPSVVNFLTQAVLAARTAGHGQAELAVFAGMMGIEPSLYYTHYPLHNTNIWLATMDAAEANMLEAAAVLREDAGDDEVVDIKVTCDATWQKRGHQSPYDVVVVASWQTGQVLDMSKY